MVRRETNICDRRNSRTYTFETSGKFAVAVRVPTGRYSNVYGSTSLYGRGEDARTIGAKISMRKSKQSATPAIHSSRRSRMVVRVYRAMSLVRMGGQTAYRSTNGNAVADGTVMSYDRRCTL